MPDDPFSPERTQLLNRAIDRAMVGGPTPILDDFDLQELLELATRLRDEMPRELPDPAFRDDLKRQLTRDRIEAMSTPLLHIGQTREVPMRSVATRSRSRSRIPSFAALSVIAAVLVAAFSIGVVGVLLNRDDSPPDSDVAIQTTTVRETMTAVVGGASTVGSEAPTGAARETVALVTQPVGQTEPPAGPAETAQALDPTVNPITPTLTEPSPNDNPATTATLPSTVAPQETTVRALAGLPAVEVDTVEQGPTAFAEGGSDGPDDSGSVEFILNTDMPDVADSAPVYRLSPPDIDPTELVADIGVRLGIVGNVRVEQYADYRDFHVDAEDGRSFHWIPETGSFQYFSLDNSVEGDLTADAAALAVRDWLAETGYPVERLAVSESASLVQEGQWQVELALAEMPELGVGHPLGVRAFVNDDGVVLSATGYWLVPESEEQATLRTAEECWGDMQTGAGYWSDGGMTQDGGEMSVVSLAVSYILTRDESGLVLQPVIQADGDFVTGDGLSESRISVFIQAARVSD